MAENGTAQPSRRWLWMALDLLWLIALAVYVLAGINLAPFHGDESTQLFMSRDYHTLALDHDLDRVMYDRHVSDDRRREQNLRLINGTVGKMVMGLAWDVAGFTVDDLPRDKWNWSYADPTGQRSQWDWNQINGIMPGAGLLRAARWSSALLTVIAVWTVFGIAWLVADAISRARASALDPRLARPATSRAAAWAASLIYATHPNLLLNGRRAMMEGSLAAFGALTVLAGLLLLSATLRPGTRERALWAWTIFLGVMAGTAISSKHTALLGVIPVYGVLLMQPPRTHWTKSPAVRRLAVSALVMALTFLLWNPAWWCVDPTLPFRVIRDRQSLITNQRDESRAYGLAYDSLLDRARGLVDSQFWQGPQYAEVPQWSGWLAEDRDEYESSGLAGRLGGPIWAVLGLGALVAGLVRAWRSRRAAAVRLVLAWGAVLALGLFLLTPMDWARYYLPLQAPAAVLAGLGAAWVVSGAARWVSHHWRMLGAALERGGISETHG